MPRISGSPRRVGELSLLILDLASSSPHCECPTNRRWRLGSQSPRLRFHPLGDLPEIGCRSDGRSDDLYLDSAGQRFLDQAADPLPTPLRDHPRRHRRWRDTLGEQPEPRRGVDHLDMPSRESDGDSFIPTRERWSAEDLAGDSFIPTRERRSRSRRWSGRRWSGLRSVERWSAEDLAHRSSDPLVWGGEHSQPMDSRFSHTKSQ